MPKIQQVVGDAEALRMVMCDRINQAISRNPGLFRPGRGRLVDFAARYGMMRTVAQRLLTGKADPSPRLLMALSKDTNLPTDFFYGLTDSCEVESHVEGQSALNIPVFQAAGYSVRVPPQMFSVRNPEQLMVVHYGRLSNNSFAVPGDYLLVERGEIITAGAVYAVLPHGEEDPSLLAISRIPASDEYVFKGSDQPEFTCSAKKIVFSEEDLSEGKLYLVGKVVGKINLFPLGVALNQI